MSGSWWGPRLGCMSEQVPPASSGAASGASSPPHPTPPPPHTPQPAVAAPPSRWNRPFLIGIAAGLGVVVLSVGAGISGDLFGGGGGIAAILLIATGVSAANPRSVQVRPPNHHSVPYPYQRGDGPN